MLIISKGEEKALIIDVGIRNWKSLKFRILEDEMVRERKREIPDIVRRIREFFLNSRVLK